MWWDDKFRQRNKVTIKNEEKGGWTKFEKGEVSNIGGLHKIGGPGTLCQVWSDR